MRRRTLVIVVAVAAALVLVLVGVSLFSHNVTPAPPAAHVSCSGDHDGDCPASEPDNDGHRSP